MIDRFVVTFLAAAAAVFVASKLFDDVRVKRTGTLFVVALIFGVINALLYHFARVIFGILLLPAALLTFGLAYLLLGLVVNTVFLWLTDKLVENFKIKSFGALLGTATLVSVALWLLRRLHLG